METNDQNQNLIHSYLALRKSVGLIGILLPFTLMIGLFLFFHADRILNSISRYYYSGMRDVLVGALCGIALFLFFYRGYDNWKKINWDKWITSICGFLAIGIAFFPGTETGPIDWIGTVHFICAISFFILLACYSIFVFTRKASNPTKQKLIRNRIYVVCGVVMIASLIAIAIYYKFFQTENSKSSFVFWGESIALIAFGISWLTKGGGISPDKAISNLNDGGKTNP
jgi:cell division protein FtsW (lipid II flippase)